MNHKHLETIAAEQDISAIDAEFTEEAVTEDTVSCCRKIGKTLVSGYQKIEDGVVTGYKKIETGAIEGFGKVVDKCVEVLFAAQGESVEDAKQRLSGKEKK